MLRILELKDKYGILDREQYGIAPEAAIENAQTVVNSEEHKTAEREITDVSEAVDGASLCIILSRMGGVAYLDPTSTSGAAGTLPVSIPALTADYAFADEILYPVGWAIYPQA